MRAIRQQHNAPRTDQRVRYYQQLVREAVGALGQMDRTAETEARKSYEQHAAQLQEFAGPSITYEIAGTKYVF